MESAEISRNERNNLENSDTDSLSDEEDSEEDDESFIYSFHDDADEYSISASSGPSDAEQNIILEHTLKHPSFFDTAQKRRRRHLLHRKEGTVPTLNFSGSHKTHFWKGYGVEPTEMAQTGSILGINTMFTEDEFNKLGPAERRIHVNGQKFKVVPNPNLTNTFYRAVAHALGMSGEKDYISVRKAIYEEFVASWPVFSRTLCLYCHGKATGTDIEKIDPSVTVDIYKRLTKNVDPPPEFELSAAAMHYGFRYSIIDLESVKKPVKMRSCTDPYILKQATAKYYFLKTSSATAGKPQCYEFLLPIGPLKKLQDGKYPAVLRDVILANRAKPVSLSTTTILDNSKNRPVLGPIPVGFALDHRIFFHRSTISHDLWSLLAELLFGKLVHAPRIKSKVMDSKHNFTLYYLACKAKKRYQVNGNAEMQRLADDFGRRFAREDPRGDVEDLVQAATYFDFSYTLIGTDARGNYFWTDRVATDSESRPYLAFFAKTNPDKSAFWFALEDIGRDCPHEQKHYAHVQSGDLGYWGGKFYFHYVPRKLQYTMNSTFSSNNLMGVPTKILLQAKDWTSSSMAKLRSSIAASYITSSYRTRSILQRIMDFLRWLINRRRVQPDKKSVQALFVKDQP